MEIKNKILKTELIEWDKFEFIQQDKFKSFTENDFDKLKKSIIKNNFIETFKVWQNGKNIYCLDGFHRCLALRKLKEEGYKVPDKFTATFINCKNKEEAAKLILIYSSSYATIKQDALKEFFENYKLDLTAIENEINLTDINIDKLKLQLNLIDEEKLDEIPDISKKPLSRLGDIFLINNKHRIMCGDSIKKEDVEKLMNRKKADMVFTDPPYNLGYTVDIDPNYRKEWSKFTNDKMTPEEWDIFVNAFLQRAYEFTKIPGVAYFWIDWRQFQFLRERMQKTFPVKACIVWTKIGGNPAWMGGDYKRAHEFCLYGKNAGKVLFNGKYVEPDVWIQKKDATGSYNHPTQKPIELCCRGIKNSSSTNDIILDLFLGSGSTLIACEQTNRICYGMEIDPIYVDVILKRYYNLYPKAKFKCLNREFNFEKLFK